VLPEWVFDEQDHQFMNQALEQARQAGARGEVPVGAVLVRAGRVIARAGNQRVERADASAHAEILVLRLAGRDTSDWRLADSTLYVTLEPCPMCVSACRQARLELVVWGTEDPVLGACGTVVDLAEDPRLGAPLAHRGGLLATASRDLLQRFFAKRRLEG
jgi:tRNA(adenine34) deaminase